MWRILSFSYKHAYVLFVAILGLSIYLSLQIPDLKVKVSSDELIPEGSPSEAKYQEVVDTFGSDEVAVIYVEDEHLFDRERLEMLKDLSRKLKGLSAVQRTESLFTVSNIRGDGGWIETAPLLKKIPRSDATLKKKQLQARENPLLLRNVISQSGTATTLTLYLNSPAKDSPEKDKFAGDVYVAIEDILGGNAATIFPVIEAELGRSLTEPEKEQLYFSPRSRVGRKFMRQNAEIADAISSIRFKNLSSIIQRPLTDAEKEFLKDPFPSPEKAMFWKKHSEARRAFEQDLVYRDYTNEFEKIFQIGSPAIQVNMTEYILEDQKFILPLSLFVLVVIIGCMIRSVQGALLPAVNSIISALMTAGAMALLDVPVNMLNYIVPALIFVIGATEDVHILVEFREALAKGLKGRKAIEDVGHHIGLTLALTGLTTVLGFAATGLTDLKIMQDFGVTAALGMFARFLVSITFLPAWLRVFGRFFKPAKPASTSVEHQNLSQRFSAFVMENIVPKPYAYITLCLLVILPCAWYASTIKLSNDLLSFLKPESPLAVKLNTLSENLSGTKVVYVTLEANPGDFKQAKKIKTIEHITNHLKELNHFDTVISLSEYLSLVNQEMYDGDTSKYKVPETDALIAQYLLFFHKSMLEPYINSDASKANIVIRCSINDSHQFNQIIAGIREQFDSGKFGPQVYSITGKSVMVAESVDQLSKGQTASISFMALTLFVIIAMLFISMKAALMSVLANLFSIILLFGIMGICGIPLNVGTCMVAAITIGIGIDDTLHLMVRYNKELKETKDELPALRKAVEAEFLPVTITSLGLAGGFLVLGTSSFIPVMQFGLLSAVVIFITVLADLLLTPLLLSRTRLITIWDLVGLNLRKQLMTTSPVFKGMNTMQAKKLILASNVEIFESGSHVVQAGEEGDNMYVVLEGELEVFITQGDKKILLSYLGMGEVFGEIALISRTKRTADVIAKSPTKLLVYDWDSLVKLRTFAPYMSSQLLLNLANILGMRLVDAQKKLESNTSAFTKRGARKKRL